MKFRPFTDEDRKTPPLEVEEIGVVFFFDRATAQRFLNALEPGGKFTFQTFDDVIKRRDERKQKEKETKVKQHDPFAYKRHGSLDQWWDRLCKLNMEGAGIYVCINETDLNGREEKNIKRVRTLVGEGLSTREI
jgi:hypothetical protein